MIEELDKRGSQGFPKEKASNIMKKHIKEIINSPLLCVLFKNLMNSPFKEDR